MSWCLVKDCTLPGNVGKKIRKSLTIDEIEINLRGLFTYLAPVCVCVCVCVCVYFIIIFWNVPLIPLRLSIPLPGTPSLSCITPPHTTTTTLLHHHHILSPPIPLTTTTISQHNHNPFTCTTTLTFSPPSTILPSSQHLSLTSTSQHTHPCPRQAARHALRWEQEREIHEWTITWGREKGRGTSVGFGYWRGGKGGWRGNIAIK